MTALDASSSFRARPPGPAVVVERDHEDGNSMVVPEKLAQDDDSARRYAQSKSGSTRTGKCRCPERLSGIV